MEFDAVMFDLDGTLADTLADIAAAANHALGVFGRPAIAVRDYRYLVGDGARNLMKRALGETEDSIVSKAVALFREYYRDRGLEHARPYEGVPQMVEALRQHGVRMAVLSNKPDAAAHQVAEHLFPHGTFDAVRGHLDGPAAPGLKPDPAAALAIAEALSVPPQRWAFVGDTAIDMQTANAAGMFAVGVLWGFRDEAELKSGGAHAIITPRSPATPSAR